MEIPALPNNEQQPPAPLPWWLVSKTLGGLLAIAVAFTLSQIRGAEISPDDLVVREICEHLIGVLGFAFSIWGRIHAQQKIAAVERAGGAQ